MWTYFVISKINDTFFILYNNCMPSYTAQVCQTTIGKIFRGSKTFKNLAQESRNIKNIIGKSIIFGAKLTKFNDQKKKLFFFFKTVSTFIKTV